MSATSNSYPDVESCRTTASCKAAPFVRNMSARTSSPGLKNIVGGELKGYTELMQEARQEAVERMIAEAQSMGANAILNVRFATTSIAAGAAEILAYGSAVQLDGN